MVEEPVRRDIATRFQPGQSGNLHRGPDRRPRRLVRNALLAALSAEGPITVQVRGPRGGVRTKTVWGKHAGAHNLLLAVQQILQHAHRNPNAVLRLIEVLAQEVDGRPMPPAGDGSQRRATTFIYEGQQEPDTDAPSSVADVVGAEPPGPDDGFERVE